MEFSAQDYITAVIPILANESAAPAPTKTMFRCRIDSCEVAHQASELAMRHWADGGRAWPNVICEDQRYELPLRLWANSTLGLILFWWRGTRQQEGRTILTITAVHELPVMDTRVLDEQQLKHCANLFEDFRHREFLPANEAYCDETRKELERALLFGITSVPKLEPDLEEGLDLLREQWCAEPSVHGGKSTRIRTHS